MGKFRKLLKSPKQFVSDSIWFGHECIKGVHKTDNLFVISHLGQLTQIESLVIQYNLKNNYLIILYTDANIIMPSIVLKNYRKKLFTGASLLRLPPTPNNLNIIKLQYIKRNYEALLKETQPNYLYVLSFEKHYSLLSKIARDNGILLNLVDEGTATYRSPTCSDKTSYTIRETIIRYLIDNIPLFREIRPALKWHTEYNCIYAAFPKLLSDAFNAKQFIHFFSHDKNKSDNNRAKNIIDRYRITNKDIIYVNQRYHLGDSLFVSAILLILSHILDKYQCKVFIKMHPKDSTNALNEFKSQINNKGLNNSIICIDESDFAIEPVLSMARPKSLFGLTSTSLIYAKMISLETTAYSIAPLFIDLIKYDVDLNSTAYKSILNHLDLLKLFENVALIEKIEDI